PSSSGSVTFPTTYHFIHGTDTYACGPGWKAVGVNGSVQTNYYLYDGNVFNINGCSYAGPLVRFEAAIDHSIGRNRLFPNEYRQFVFPKKWVLEVPAGLMLDGF